MKELLTLQLHNPELGSGVREILPLSSQRRHSGGGLGPSHVPGVTEESEGNKSARKKKKKSTNVDERKK